MIKFTIIFLCFLNTFLGETYSHDKRDTALLRLGMAFTLAADFHMILLNRNGTGILLFSVVQIIYNFRYAGFHSTKKQMITGSFVFIVFLMAGFDLLLCAGAAYAALLSFSVINARGGSVKYPYPVNRMIFIGMLLFMCCDIHVALSYFNSNNNFIAAAVWVYYIPSQILLSSSGRKLEYIRS